MAQALTLAPSWASLVPAFAAVLKDGTAQGRALVLGELARMAEAADAHNAQADSSATLAQLTAQAAEEAAAEARKAAELVRVFMGQRTGGNSARALTALDVAAAAARDVATHARAAAASLTL